MELLVTSSKVDSMCIFVLLLYKMLLVNLTSLYYAAPVPNRH